jgi:hypothetical protein
MEGVRCGQQFPLNFALYLLLLRNIAKIFTHTLSSSMAVLFKFFSYTHYNHKISFLIPTFHLLTNFHLITITHGHKTRDLNIRRGNDRHGGEKATVG